MQKLIRTTKRLLPYLILAAYALPLSTVRAQDTPLETAFGQIWEIVYALIPIAFGIIVFYFFWGLAKYVMAGGDEEKKKDGRSMMIYGVIGMFVAGAIWGIVAVISQTFGTTGSPFNIPGIRR